MKNIKITFFILLIISLSSLAIRKYSYLNLKKDTKNKEEKVLIEFVRVLTECFDLENKNKRTLKESRELIEYCLNEYKYK